MVSTLSRQEKFNQARRNFCFYLDIQDHGLCRSISRRLQDMGLQQEACLSARVTHVVREGGGAAAPRWRRDSRTRADAMLERVRHATPQNHVLLSVDKAIALLDKLYDTFFAAPRKSNVRLFTKPFIKIEFLDKQCRPLYKEFDAWPEISLEPNPEKKEKKESTINQGVVVNNNYQNIIGQNREMTRKNNRPRIKEKEDKEPAGGYCESCGAMFADLAAHARSPRHAAFARDTSNFLALDSLIGASFLPVNGTGTGTGERRSLRNVCNGELARRESPVNGLDDEPRRTRCRKSDQDDRQYYKVVGVSTKLRSSGGFVTKRKDSSPTCNGAKPLVVKFRKVRRSELSVLSDEAEQFMFPKRASSTSSNSSDDDDDEKSESRRKTPPEPAPTLERRRQARPTALKEESSEEDSWLDDKQRRKRRGAPVVRRTRRAPFKPPTPEPEPPPKEEPTVEAEPVPDPEPEVSPLREEPVEKCMKWEDGKLKYTPAVEQLEFAFEMVPRSEPWFETFTRQDHDQVSVKNVPRCFALYSKSPKLPYEIGQLPPLKPNCCPLSNLAKPAAREPRSERYGTRGLKTRKLHKRIAAIAAQDSRPRKSPREHASTLAMLGSAGIHRRAPDDAKSTASEDTVSDALSSVKPEPSEAQEADERLQKFLSEVFDDAAEFELDDVDGGPLPAAAAPPDVVGLVSECDGCDMIRKEIADNAERRRARRRGRFKKKNKTGWPNKKRPKKGARTDSSDKTESSLDRSSVASRDTADTADTADTGDDDLSEIEETPKVKSEDEAGEGDAKSEDKPLRLDVKVLLEDQKKAEGVAKRGSARSSVSEEEERGRKKKRALTNLAGWLQPVVRVARVDATARRLRSAAKPRAARPR